MPILPARPSAVALRAAVSVGVLLLLAQPAAAATIVAGVRLTVNPDNTVTVTSSGTSQFFGDVGSAGNFGFVGGWGVSSGQITWRDTNNNIAATLGTGGVGVPVSHRVANENGSKTGSVVITGSTVLGAAMRTSFRGGDHAFTSVAARGSIPYEFSGTVTIPKRTATLIDGIFLEVDALTRAVTVVSGGSPVAFGDVGDGGLFGLLNGWRVADGDLTWRDTASRNIATLHRSGLQVWTPGGTANGSILGVLELSASSELGTALVNQFGEGTFAFSSLAVETPTTEFYFLGSAVIRVADRDGDGVADVIDNCTDVANPGQEDVDAGEDDDSSLPGIQHYGDACDVDLDNDGTVGASDFFGVFRPCLGAALVAAPGCARADLDGDGVVGASDFFGVLRPALGTTPGPGVTE